MPTSLYFGSCSRRKNLRLLEVFHSTTEPDQIRSHAAFQPMLLSLCVSASQTPIALIRHAALSARVTICWRYCPRYCWTTRNPRLSYHKFQNDVVSLGSSAPPRTSNPHLQGPARWKGHIRDLVEHVTASHTTSTSCPPVRVIRTWHQPHLQASRSRCGAAVMKYSGE